MSRFFLYLLASVFVLSLVYSDKSLNEADDYNGISQLNNLKTVGKQMSNNFDVRRLLSSNKIDNDNDNIADIKNNRNKNHVSTNHKTEMSLLWIGIIVSTASIIICLSFIGLKYWCARIERVDNSIKHYCKTDLTPANNKYINDEFIDNINNKYNNNNNNECEENENDERIPLSISINRNSYNNINYNTQLDAQYTQFPEYTRFPQHTPDLEERAE